MDILTKKVDTDSPVLLSAISYGAVFHFASISFKDALAEDAFYIKMQGEKEGKVSIINIKDGLHLICDVSHLIYKVDAKFIISTNEGES